MATELSSTQASAWRDGPFLVLRNTRQELPDHCMMCDVPVGPSRFKTVVRRPFGLAVTIIALVTLGFAFLFALLFLPKAKLKVPICRAHLAPVRRRIRIAVVLLVMGLCLVTGTIMVGPLLPDSYLEAALLIEGLGAACLPLSLLAYCFRRTKTVVVHKMDRHFVWLEAAAEKFLERLPAAS